MPYPCSSIAISPWLMSRSRSSSFFPAGTTWTKNYQEFIHQVAGQDAIEHAGRVVGIEFANTDEAEEFFRKLDSVDAVMPLIERPELVLFSDEWDESLEEQVHKNWQEFGEPYGMSVGLSFWANFYNRYSQATDLLRRSSELRASPLIHASTVWRWVKWKLESSAERSHPALAKTPKSCVCWDQGQTVELRG